MRIGQYTDTFIPIVDGVGRVVVSYARTMGEMGHDVTVFAPKADMGDTASLPYEVVTYNAVPMPGKMPYRVGFPQLDIQFERRLQGIGLDIVHVHSPFMTGHAGVHLAKKRGIPVVGSFHSKYYDDFTQVLKVDKLARTGVKIVVDFYMQCDEVWAVSSATATTLQEYGYPGEIVVMPNGTDLRTLDERMLPALASQYAIRPEEPMLLYVGQLNWKKNIRRILEAARLLVDRGCRFKLLFAGQGPHREEIEQAVQTMGLSANIAFTGHVADTRALDGLYAMASLFVFPSLYDNAPMVVREAAAMGTPPVLVAGSNAAEGVEEGINGLLCEDNAASLAETIARGLADADALAAMGEAARRTIPVSWKDLMGQVTDRYARLIERCAQG